MEKEKPSVRIEKNSYLEWQENGWTNSKFEPKKAIDEIAKILDELHEEIQEVKQENVKTN